MSILTWSYIGSITHIEISSTLFEWLKFINFAPGNYIEVIGRALYDYSLKNIPIPSKTSYNLKLIEKIESVIKRMWWKAYFFLNEGKCQSDNKNTFGFTSRYHPTQIFELEKFEKDLFNIANSIKFSNNRNDFRQKLDADIADVKQSKNVFVFANKTSNIYKM